MVTSRLDKTIIYNENNTVYDDDIDYESSLYQIEVYNLDLIIALGNIKNTFIKKGILYVPIYFVF